MNLSTNIVTIKTDHHKKNIELNYHVYLQFLISFFGTDHIFSN